VQEVRSVTQTLYRLFEDVKQKAHIDQVMNRIIQKRNRERLIRHVSCTFFKEIIKEGPTGELAAIVGIHGVGGSIRAITNAIRPIAASRSVVFQGTYQMDGQPIRFIDGRFMRPGLAYHTVEAGEDADQKHTIVTNYLRGKALMIIPSQKMALVIQLDNGPGQLSLSKTDGSEKLRNLIKQAQEDFSGEVEYIGKSQIKGEKVVGYCMNEDCAIWADAENLLPLQIEYSTERQLGLKGSINMTNINYNVPLNQNKFSIHVREAYTHTVIHMNDSLPSEIDLIDTLQMCAHSVDGEFPAALNIAAATKLIGTFIRGEEAIACCKSFATFLLLFLEHHVCDLHYGENIFDLRNSCSSRRSSWPRNGVKRCRPGLPGKSINHLSMGHTL